MKVLLNVCVRSVKFLVFPIPPLFGVLCFLIIKICFHFRMPKNNRPSVVSSAAEVDDYAV